MANLFEDDRIYLPDAELEIIGDKAKLNQWRHKGVGPAHYKLGRKILYHGSDLNDWAEANRVDPTGNRQTSLLLETKPRPRNDGIREAALTRARAL